MRDDKLSERPGCHAFRRGLRTTLYALGVDDLMIQQMLGHEDVAVTREHYIQNPNDISADRCGNVETGVRFRLIVR
jgi:integrase